MPSIKEALSAKPDGEPQQPEILREPAPTVNIDRPVDKEQLLMKWQEYMGRLEKKPGLITVMSRFPEITEGNLLKLKIENSVVNDEIGKIKNDLVLWLRNELQNNSIDLVTEIEISDVGRKPYSESEKLAEMVKKNPNINLLKQKFNLDFGDV